MENRIADLEEEKKELEEDFVELQSELRTAKYQIEYYMNLSAEHRRSRTETASRSYYGLLRHRYGYGFDDVLWDLALPPDDDWMKSLRAVKPLPGI